jgi:hypothetical protein
VLNTTAGKVVVSTSKVAVIGVKLAPPFVLIRIRYWNPGPPNRSVDGLITWPEKLICPPNGHAAAEKPTNDMPVAKPVT